MREHSHLVVMGTLYPQLLSEATEAGVVLLFTSHCGVLSTTSFTVGRLHQAAHGRQHGATQHHAHTVVT